MVNLVSLLITFWMKLRFKWKEKMAKQKTDNKEYLQGLRNVGLIVGVKGHKKLTLKHQHKKQKKKIRRNHCEKAYLRSDNLLLRRDYEAKLGVVVCCQNVKRSSPLQAGRELNLESKCLKAANL
ncbi:hypothetical protein Bca4012_008569 [Brassica carinata]